VIRRIALLMTAAAGVTVALGLPLRDTQRAPAGWLDDLCPPAMVEAVAHARTASANEHSG
jgi:hypothetical protein